MKEFIRMTLATICGIAIFLTVSTLLFIVSLVGMIAADSTTPVITDNSVFTLKLSGTIEERAADDNPIGLLLGQNDLGSYGLDDIIASIRKAKTEDNIKGIYIQAGAVSFDSPATLQRIREELKDFKKSGKWIVAYADQYLQGAYYLCSVADKVYMNAEGMLDFKGMGTFREYDKGLYDKLGIRYQVAKVGKYKSAIEGYILTGMSDADREQKTVYLNTLWQSMLKDISASRNIPVNRLNQMANDSILALAESADYIKSGLIDGIKYPEDLQKEIKQRLGIDQDKDIHQLSLSDMTALVTNDYQGEEIAVYYACGEIIDEKVSSFYGSQNMVGQTVVKDLKELADDDKIKAVVLRINSPGGSAAASEQIHHAIQQLKAKKPVVVSMGGVAASGGYMISAGSDYIFAEPNTITGSIGIFGLIPNFSGLVTDKLGITFDGVTTNKYTNWENDIVLGKNNEELIQFFQKYTDRGYNRFLRIVANGRNMSLAQVDRIAQGRVWLGTDAQKIKLVDKIGNLDDAVKKAASLAKIKDYHTSAYPAKADWLDMLFSKDAKGNYLDAQMRNTLGDLYEPVMELKRDKERNKLQAKLPFSTKTE